MARVWLLTYFLLLSFAVCTLAVDYRQLKVPENRISGVFVIPEGGGYIFNASEARAACLFLNVAIATKAQVDAALRHGLQTCRFGWTDEQVAVIPRIIPEPRCGQNRTGLVAWKASADKRFGAYCYKAPDFEIDLTTTTDIPVTSKSATTLPALTRVSTRVTSRVRPMTRARTLRKPTTRAPRRTPRTTTTPTRPIKSSRSTRSSSTSLPFTTTSTITATTPSLSHSTTSSLSTSCFLSSTTAVTSTTSVLFPASSSVSSPSLHITTDYIVSLPSVSSAGASIGAIATTLIILTIILVLLTIAAGVWYYKLKRSVFPFWSRGQKNDDTATEMWKQTENDMDLQNQQGGEEGADRKYSSDTPLCANPEIKTNSS